MFQLGKETAVALSMYQQATFLNNSVENLKILLFSEPQGYLSVRSWLPVSCLRHTCCGRVWLSFDCPWKRWFTFHKINDVDETTVLTADMTGSIILTHHLGSRPGRKKQSEVERWYRLRLQSRADTLRTEKLIFPRWRQVRLGTMRRYVFKLNQSLRHTPCCFFVARHSDWDAPPFLERTNPKPTNFVVLRTFRSKRAAVAPPPPSPTHDPLSFLARGRDSLCSCYPMLLDNPPPMLVGQSRRKCISAGSTLHPQA